MLCILPFILILNLPFVQGFPRLGLHHSQWILLILLIIHLLASSRSLQTYSKPQKPVRLESRFNARAVPAYEFLSSQAGALSWSILSKPWVFWICYPILFPLQLQQQPLWRHNLNILSLSKQNPYSHPFVRILLSQPQLQTWRYVGIPLSACLGTRKGSQSGYYRLWVPHLHTQPAVPPLSPAALFWRADISLETDRPCWLYSLVVYSL